jgi:hypothetical protein
MPKNEPDASDPFELVAVGADIEGSTSCMAECLAQEFLSMGHGVQEVMTIFRSPVYALAHRAWSELGDVQVFLMVSGLAERRERSRTIRGGIHV